MTFDEKLAIALRETAQKRSEQVFAVTNRHRFSLSYKLWKYKTLKDIRCNRLDSRWTLHKARRAVTALVIAAAIVLSMTACAVVKLAIGRFSFDDKTDYSKLFIENLSSDKTRIEEYYGLPEKDGWVIKDFYSDDCATTINYKRGDEIIMFAQETIRENMGIVNTENAVVEPMSLYEENDGFFIFHNQKNSCALYWIYDGYFFEIMGNLDKDELIKLAYSTKIVEF